MTSREERLTPVVTADHTERARRVAEEARAWKNATQPWAPPFSDLVADTLDVLVAALAAAEQRAKDAEQKVATSRWAVREVAADATSTADAAVARADALARRLTLVSRWLDDEQDAGLQVPAPVRAALVGEEGADE